MNNLTSYLTIFLVGLVIYTCLTWNHTEGFSFTPKNPKCLDCYYKNAQECSACPNCAICKRGPFATCVPGSSNGPTFGEDCGKYIFDQEEKATIKSKHWKGTPPNPAQLWSIPNPLAHIH